MKENKEPAASIKKPAQAEDNFRYIVRITNTDLDGKKQVFMALQKIKGVNFMFSHAICEVLKLDKKKKTGNLTDKEVESLNDALKHPEKYKIPEWMFNRRKDQETGKNIHLVGTDLNYTVENDIKNMIRLRIYRGVRHSFHLPVRGQNTKSNFRKSKVKNAAKKKRGGPKKE